MGAGKYGSALGFVIQEQESNRVVFLVRRQEQADEIALQHTNAKISKDALYNKRTSATTDTSEAIQDADYIFLCIPA